MPGKLVHVEISAADVDRAQGFWSGVFGWEISPSGMPGMDYRLFRTGEDQGGGLMAGEPGSLTVYFDTDEIEATIEKVRSGYELNQSIDAAALYTNDYVAKP